jgi:cell division septation protein DedD
MGRMTMDEVMITPGLDNLHIITSGTIPPNPAELIESRRFMDFMEDAKKEYDIILFDSTPILSTADAAILGSKVEGVLLVYRVGSVSRGLLKRSATQLEQVKSNIIGVILNGMKPDISPDFHDFKHYRYYSTYATEGDDDEKGDGIKKLFSLPGKRKKELTSSKRDSRSSFSVQSDASKPEPRPTNIFMKWVFILAALVLIAVGLLWQNNMIGPLKSSVQKEPVSEDQAQPSAFKKTVDIQAQVTPPAAQSEQPDTLVSAPSEVLPVSEPIIPEKDIDQEQATGASMPEAELIPQYASGSFPYSIYLGSVQTEERVKKALSIYTEKGLSPFIVRIEFKEKGVWYRIYANCFKDQEGAQELINNKNISEAEIKKTSYAVLVGTYTSQDEQNAMIQSLKDSGYYPYVIEYPVNVFRLFAGAFITEAGAKGLSIELESMGIKNEVVER